MAESEENLPEGDENAAEAWTFQQIGAFIFWFSQAETALKFALAEALELPTDLIDPVSGSYDFRTLCGVARAACLFRCDDPVAAADIEKLIKLCLEMNDIRVRIVHGSWNPSASGPHALHMSRQSLKVSAYFEDPDQLAEAVEKCQRLAGDLISFPGGSMWAFLERPGPARVTT